MSKPEIVRLSPPFLSPSTAQKRRRICVVPPPSSSIVTPREWHREIQAAYRHIPSGADVCARTKLIKTGHRQIGFNYIYFNRMGVHAWIWRNDARVARWWEDTVLQLTNGCWGTRNGRWARNRCGRINARACSHNERLLTRSGNRNETQITSELRWCHHPADSLTAGRSRWVGRTRMADGGVVTISWEWI